MTETDPDATSSPDSTGSSSSDAGSGRPTSEHPEALGCAIFLQGGGAILALSPLGWSIAGIAIAAFGTLITCGFAPSQLKIAVGRAPAVRYRRLYRTEMIWGSLLMAAGVLAAAAGQPGRGVTFAVLGLFPLVVGIATWSVVEKISLTVPSRIVDRLMYRAVVIALLATVLVAPASGRIDGFAMLALLYACFGSVVFLHLMLFSPLRSAGWIAAMLMAGVIALGFNGIGGGHQAWLSLTKGTPQTCSHVSTERLGRLTHRSPDRFAHWYQCGDRRVRYGTWFHSTGEHAAAQEMLMVDRLGITGSLRPSEIPGVWGVIYLVNLAVTVAALVTAILTAARRRRMQGAITNVHIQP